MDGCSTVFLIHLPTKGHFGSFQFVAIMYKAAVNIYVRIFV